MPLDHENGEVLDGLGRGFRVAKHADWKHTSLWDTACKDATKVFRAAGALLPIAFSDRDILIQEYPRERKLAFIFARGIARQEMFHVYVFDMPQDLIAELRATGRWSHEH